MIFPSEVNSETVSSLVLSVLVLMLAGQFAARVIGKSLHGRGQTLILGVTSFLIAGLPVGDFPVAFWLNGINVHISIPFMAMLLGKVWDRATGVRLFDTKALMSAWIFGLTAGAILYPMGLGLGSFDPYTSGWEFSWLFMLLLLATLGLLLMRNRFGVVLIVCILAYNLLLLESSNLWDYLVDPLYVITSAVALGFRLGTRTK